MKDKLVPRPSDVEFARVVLGYLKKHNAYAITRMRTGTTVYYRANNERARIHTFPKAETQGDG